MDRNHLEIATIGTPSHFMSGSEVYGASVREVGSAIIALGQDGQSVVAFCARCDWSCRSRTDEELARAIADHMRHWNRTHEELEG